MVLTPGTQVGGYRLIRLVGEGGMGYVWEAEQISLGRRVALKVVRSNLAVDSQFRDRFEGEAKAAAAIDHPNVVTVYDSGEVDGSLFLSMALVAGPDLKELIDQEGKVAPERAAAILSDVAAGLDAAHFAGIIHRDVKPSNILLGVDLGRALITDFGIAKALDKSGETATGLTIGTARYMSPEQIQGQTVGPRSDVYSLATVMQEMLSGKAPMERETPVATMWAQVHDAPPAASAVDGVPAALDPVLAKGLAKDPAQRYATPGELAAAASAALGVKAGDARTQVIDDKTRLIRHGVEATSVMGAKTAVASSKNPPPVDPMPVPAQATGDANAASRWPKRILIAALLLLAGSLAGGLSAVAVPVIFKKETTTSVSVSTTTESTTETTTTTDSSGSSTASYVGGTETVSGDGYDAELPSGWNKTPDRYPGENPNGTRYKWTNPDNSNVFVVIETTPGDGTSNLKSAQANSTSLDNATVSEQPLAGDSSAAVINFTYKDATRDDYFLNPCGTGVAVLGSAPSSLYSDWSSTFYDVANSVVCPGE